MKELDFFRKKEDLMGQEGPGSPKMGFWSFDKNLIHLCILFCLNMKVSNIWDKVFKNRPSKICGRQPFKKLERYGLLKLEYFVPFLPLTFCKNQSLGKIWFWRYGSEISRPIRTHVSFNYNISRTSWLFVFNEHS